MRIGVAIVTSDFDSERKGLTPLSSTLIILKILNMKKYNWDKKRIEEAVKISKSYTETLKNLNIQSKGSNS